MLPTPSQLSSIDPIASRLLYHIRKHMERDGIRGATQQTIALRVTWCSGLALWFEPLIGNRYVRATTVKEANRSMYATGWQIKKATIKNETQKGYPSYNKHLHLRMVFDASRMSPEDAAAHMEEERQAAITEARAVLDEATALVAKLRAELLAA